MSTTAVRPRRTKRAPEPWFGPHFQYDIIRLARKGWPTLARVLYLVALLVSLVVMWRTQGNTIDYRNLAQYAERAQDYATTLIVIQDLLVLVLLPVYVASAIAEEKENQTLEALTLTHLTDRELVLGKLGARLMHLGMVVLSGLPILAFMHLWGNVPLDLLVYFETHTFLLLITAGAVCIWVSTRSESVFQAISGSYPWMGLIGFISMSAGFSLPWMCGTFQQLLDWIIRLWQGLGGGFRSNPEASYLPCLPALLIAHGLVVLSCVANSIRRMDYLRRSEKRNPRKSTGAMMLSDAPQPASIPGKRGQVRSKIHPLAWPIGGNALFWKECVKDGSSWSLKARWLVPALGVVVIGAAIYHLFYVLADAEGRRTLPIFAYDFAFGYYLLPLAAYLLTVAFQLTMTVAGEREHGTLITLLMVPADRHEVLLTKWLGPWVRNWPILAVAYLGALFGLLCGLYGPAPALLLLFLPWPILLFIGGLALWLSVMCRRVLFANIALVGVLGVLFIAHVAFGTQTQAVLAFFVAVFGDFTWRELGGSYSFADAALLAFGEQALFLLVGILCLLASFRSFARRDYANA